MTALKATSLPSGWIWARLGQICEFNPRAWNKPLIKDDEISFIPMAAVSPVTGMVDTAGRRTWEEVEKKSYTRFQEGDILFAKVTPCMENGKIAIASGLLEGRGIGSTEFHILRPSNLVSRRYLLHFLRQKSFRAAAERSMSGAVGLRRVPVKFLENQLIPLPPLPEQHRIVEALEVHLSRLDAATESIVSARRRLKPFISSVLDRATLGTSLVDGPERATSGISCHSLTGRTSKRFDYAGLPLLPEGWLWRVSSDVCEFIGSGSTPKAHMMYAGTGDIPFLKVYNITQDGRIDFTNRPTFVDVGTHQNQLKRSRVLPGDVITNIVGPPLGKTAVVPGQFPEWNINQAIVAFRAGSEVLPEWLALVLRAPFVLGMLKRTAKATAGQFNIALSTCRELPLPIPPLDVQREVIARSVEQLEASDRVAYQIVPNILRAENLRQAVLRRAFSGQLVSQSAVDEPVSALPDRIRSKSDTWAEKSQTMRHLSTPNLEITADGPPPPAQNSRGVSTIGIQQELPF